MSGRELGQHLPAGAARRARRRLRVHRDRSRTGGGPAATAAKRAVRSAQHRQAVGGVLDVDADDRLGAARGLQRGADGEPRVRRVCVADRPRLRGRTARARQRSGRACAIIVDVATYGLRQRGAAGGREPSTAPVGCAGAGAGVGGAVGGSTRSSRPACVAVVRAAVRRAARTCGGASGRFAWRVAWTSGVRLRGLRRGRERDDRRHTLAGGGAAVAPRRSSGGRRGRGAGARRRSRRGRSGRPRAAGGGCGRAAGRSSRRGRIVVEQIAPARAGAASGRRPRRRRRSARARRGIRRVTVKPPVAVPVPATRPARGRRQRSEGSRADRREHPLAAAGHGCPRRSGG